MRFKDNMSPIITNTQTESVNTDSECYTNNFLKPNKAIIPSMGMCHRQQRWNNTIHLPRRYNIHYSNVAWLSSNTLSGSDQRNQA